MKSTGIIRRIDPFGRIVLPMEIRRMMELEPDSAVEMFIDGASVVVRKYTPSCVFCGNIECNNTFEGKLICDKCIKRISGLSGEET